MDRQCIRRMQTEWKRQTTSIERFRCPSSAIQLVDHPVSRKTGSFWLSDLPTW
jgi:hypothetical protein